MQDLVMVSREEFEQFCECQYPPEVAMKTMRTDKLDRIVDFLKGGQPPNGGWRYRMINKGYTLVDFPELGLEEVLCLKGTSTQDGSIEHGMYGEWRKVVAVEEFYDILLEAHVKVQNHGGYKNLMKALERDYVGVPREACSKFVSLCTVCQNNPRQRLKTAQATEACRNRVIKLPCVTRDFNRRCQIDLMDMTQNPDSGFNYVGVYTDHWTKFVTLFPMQGMTVHHIATALCSSVFPYYGPPQFLHTPNGKEFADEIIKHAMEKWTGGERSIIPQGKPGLMHLADVVETTREMMVQMINQRSLDENIEGPIPWVRWLGKIMFDINSQENSNTGRAPYSRVYERNVGPGTDSESSFEPVQDVAFQEPKAKQTLVGVAKPKKRPAGVADNCGSAVISTYKKPPPAADIKRPRTFVAIKASTSSATKSKPVHTVVVLANANSGVKGSESAKTNSNVEGAKKTS